MFKWIKEKATKTKDWLWGKTKGLYDFIQSNKPLGGLVLWCSTVAFGSVGAIATGVTKIVELIHAGDGKNGKENSKNHIIYNNETFTISHSGSFEIIDHKKEKQEKNSNEETMDTSMSAYTNNLNESFNEYCNLSLNDHSMGIKEFENIKRLIL